MDKWTKLCGDWFSCSLRALVCAGVVGCLVPSIMLAATVSLTVSGPQSGTTYYAGDSYTFTITGGAPNAAITLNMNSAQYQIGTTGSNGSWSSSGTWGPTASGSYTETWYVAGVKASPTLSFQILPLPTPTVSLAVSGPQSGTTYYAGDGYTFSVAGGAPNAAITLNMNGAQYQIGTTGSNGSWSSSGTWGPTIHGSYTETWYVAGVKASPTLSFQILPLPTPTVSLTVTGPQVGTIYYTGDGYAFAITGGAPNAAVTLNMNGTQYQIGTTGPNGSWSSSGTWGSTASGSYTETWYVAGVQASPTLSFQILDVSIGDGRTPGPGGPPDPILPTPTATPPAAQTGSAQNCSDITGTWSYPYLTDPAGSPLIWNLSLASDGTVSGTLTSPFCQATYPVSGTTGASGTVNLKSVTSVDVGTCRAPYYYATIITASVTQIGCTSATSVSISVTRAASGQRATTYAATTPPPPPPWTRLSTPPGITLTTDLYNDLVTVVLAGQNKTANLSLTISGNQAPPKQGPILPITLGQASNVGPNTYKFDYQRTSLPVGNSYTAVTATWGSISVTAPANFTTLGLTRFSTYNTPTESMCNGSDTLVYVFKNDGTCTYTYGKSVTLKDDFRRQTITNGTGSSISYGVIKPYGSTLLAKDCPLPNGGTNTNTFVKVTAVTGSCSTKFSPLTTIATSPNPKGDTTGQWNCMDQVLLVGPGDSKGSPRNDSIKVVQDACPICSDPSQFNGTAGHIDTYTSQTFCRPSSSLNIDYGNFYGIKLR